MIPSKSVKMGTLLLTLVSFFMRSSGSAADGVKAVFHNPILDTRWPDPFCYKHTDGYYYMAKFENTENLIALYQTDILHDWRNARRSNVYLAPPGRGGLWAPEVHFIQGNFYIYFAMDDGNNVNHRMHVIMALDAKNPMGSYSSAKRLDEPAPGISIWAIDGTVLKYNNGPNGTERLYFIWSGWPEVDSEFPQNLYIAPMSDPETLSGPRVLINEPTEPWQMIGAPLLEGPQVLQRKDRTYVIYSASGSWGPDYNLGLMGIDGYANPMVPQNWWKAKEPVFRRNDAESVFGVGHASFTTSKDGNEDWIVYHAMQGANAGWENRTARIQQFSWNPDHTPKFPLPLGFSVGLDIPSGQ